jgi:hypothetical protein
MSAGWPEAIIACGDPGSAFDFAQAREDLGLHGVRKGWERG